MIEALNGLFTATQDAFMLPGLDYHPVAMGDKERKSFTDTSLERADLQVWMLPQAPDGAAHRPRRPPDRSPCARRPPKSRA